MRRVLLFTILAVLFLSLECRRADGVAEDPIEREAEELLVQYLRIDTTNPPGNETRGAKFLAEVLRKEGIEAKLLGSDPARQSLYARLSSGVKGDALLLMHHIDVVPSEPSQWSVPPFSGERGGGYLWGRGALDIKSLGIAELMAFVDLKRSGAKLSRDVILLAVADEEAGGLRGCKEILERHPELFSDVGAVINEGGANETVVDRVSVWGVEVAQKVPLWFRVRTRGVPGHGAIPPDDGGAPGRLLEVLTEIRRMPRPYRLIPVVDRYFDRLAQKKPGAKGEMLRDPQPHLGSPELEKVLPPSYRSLLRDTLVVTRISAGANVNSIPGEAIADVDMRLLPDSSPDEILSAVRAIAGNRGEVEVILRGEASSDSPIDHPLYQLLEKTMRASDKGSIVVPMVSPGTSDSRFFRNRGVAAYGISPFKVGYYDADTIHGVDEKIRSRFFRDGVKLTRHIVRDYCAKK